MTQSLPRRWGSPSADNSSRRGEQPLQAPGQTTVNQSNSPLFFGGNSPSSLRASVSTISVSLLRSRPTEGNSGLNLQPGYHHSEHNGHDVLTRSVWGNQRKNTNYRCVIVNNQAFKGVS